MPFSAIDLHLPARPGRRCLSDARLVAGLSRRAPAAAEDLAALLARPVSPGSIAMLAEHATQPAAQKRLIEAVEA